MNNRPEPRRFADSSVVEVDGNFFQIAHRWYKDRVQFALIHMEGSTQRPTNMFEPWARIVRDRFYRDVDPGLIDWYVVHPPGLYGNKDLTVNAVSMKCHGGVYLGAKFKCVSPRIHKELKPFLMEPILRLGTSSKK
jgi:hypothetical protein